MGASKLFCGCFHHAFLVSRHRNADKLYSDRIEAILSDTPNHVAQISNFSATMVLYQSWQGVNSWIKGPTKENLGLVLFWWRCSILYQILFFGLFKHSWIHIFEVASCYILDSWTPISMTFIKVGSQFWIARLWNFMDPISIVARKTPRFFCESANFGWSNPIHFSRSNLVEIQKHHSCSSKINGRHLLGLRAKAWGWQRVVLRLEPQIWAEPEKTWRWSHLKSWQLDSGNQTSQWKMLIHRWFSHWNIFL